MHRSNNICPISAIWTVVCCVFDSAGFFIGVTYAGKNTPYTSLKISLLPPPHTLQVSPQPCRKGIRIPVRKDIENCEKVTVYFFKQAQEMIRGIKQDTLHIDTAHRTL